MKAKCDFYEYVLIHEGEDSPYGDLAYDVKRDDRFPHNPSSKEELRHAMFFTNCMVGGTGNIDDAVSTAFELYDKWKLQEV